MEYIKCKTLKYFNIYTQTRTQLNIVTHQLKKKIKFMI